MPPIRAHEGRHGSDFARYTAGQVLSISAGRARARTRGSFGGGLNADPRLPLLRSHAHRLGTRLVCVSADELQVDVGWCKRRRLELREQRQLVLAQCRAVSELRAAL